jgi:hypothetical protein
MHQIPDLESLNYFRPPIEHDVSFTATEKPAQKSEFIASDFMFSQRRERIDSEDFVFPPTSSNKRDFDFMHQEIVNSFAVPEEAKVPRKPSVVANIDPNLVQLEAR